MKQRSPFVDIFQRGQAFSAFPSPWVQNRSRQVRQANQGIIAGAGRVPEWFRRYPFDSLLHSVLNLAVAPPSTIMAWPVINEDCVLSARK